MKHFFLIMKYIISIIFIFSLKSYSIFRIFLLRLDIGHLLETKITEHECTQEVLGIKKWSTSQTKSYLIEQFQSSSQF